VAPFPQPVLVFVPGPVADDASFDGWLEPEVPFWSVSRVIAEPLFCVSCNWCGDAAVVPPAPIVAVEPDAGPDVVPPLELPPVCANATAGPTASKATAAQNAASLVRNIASSGLLVVFVQQSPPAGRSGSAAEWWRRELNTRYAFTH
jgi:hypothetical protein